MRAVGIDPGRYRCLVMLGQGGTGLWDYIVAQGSQSPDPFDEASKGLAAEFVTSYLDGAPWEIVYPGGALLPLSRLAEGSATDVSKAPLT